MAPGADTPVGSGSGALAVAVPAAIAGDRDEFARLWQGFMTARWALALVLVALQGWLYASGSAQSQLLLVVCVAHFLGCFATRTLLRPRHLGNSFSRRWGGLVGVDLAAFATLQIMQGNNVNYTPLFALPILLTAVLGSLRLALGTAAGVSVLFLSNALWVYWEHPADTMPYFVQSALSGSGYFVMAFLANQLARRLASEGHKARQSELAAHIQGQVNELVIESLPDGVMVVDAQGNVRAINPPARQFLNLAKSAPGSDTNLSDNNVWQPLQAQIAQSFFAMQEQEAEVTLHHAGQGPLKLLVRTRLADALADDSQPLCVAFLQDQRTQEARIRTERLASMGRMSAAVAHEIRNPLAAIAQANALLEEDLTDASQKRLTRMVGQNAKRLERIVEEILDVSRIHVAPTYALAHRLTLNPFIHRICVDWGVQSARTDSLWMEYTHPELVIHFDSEHLRRVLVNLLENAKRYASQTPQAIQVLSTVEAQHAVVTVWSDGAPMDQSVEQHLFEPFFSSESRSSGLGLYICRELCERNQAQIRYQRSQRTQDGQQVDGNAFIVTIALPSQEFSSAPTEPHTVTP